MKEEVPPALVQAHVKSVEEAKSEGKDVSSAYNLEKTGIAGTEKEPEKEPEAKPKEEPKEESKEEKKEEEVSLECLD